jgi:cell division protein FtsA
LDAGIFITGGASQLNGLSEFLEEKAGIKVQQASVRRIYTNNATFQNPSYSQCFGLMLLGKDDCEKTPVQPELEKPKPQEEQTEKPVATGGGKKKEKEAKGGWTMPDIFGGLGKMFKDTIGKEE